MYYRTIISQSLNRLLLQMSTILLLVLSIFATIGGVVVLLFLKTLLYGIYARLLRPAKNIVKKFGQWAVVTGATDGIGKAMAFELARKGLSVILISRSLEKLEASAAELRAKYPNVEVRVLAIDYSAFNEAARKLVADALAGIDVGVLVNNVGVSYPYTQYFHELDDDRVSQLLTLNVDSTTWMTRLVLAGMVERKKGAIVNIGSAAGVSTSPLLAQYGAAKAYVAMFSRALNGELAKFNVHVQCQVPMFVTTKLAKLKHTSLFVASPAAYARAAVAAIGYETVVSPFWSHALQIWALTTLPEWVVSRLTLSMHLGIRKAGMKKEGKADGQTSTKAKPNVSEKKLT